MKKINVAELLRNCPSGMELDCSLYENLEFDKIDEDNDRFPIVCKVKRPTGYNIHTFTEDGCGSTLDYAKCVIFPKGKTTWKGFHRPFKDGDIVATDCGWWSGIIKNKYDTEYYTVHCALDSTFNDKFLIKGEYCFSRFATEEEKQRLFDAIKANGYKWNAETNTLMRLPKFKVGDKVRVKNGVSEPRIIDGVFDTFYSLQMIGKIDFTDQDNWELVPNKFDINTLSPFDKVLVRDFDNTPWEIEFFSRLLDGKHFKCHELSYVQCIPYEGNEHLLGKKDDCDEYFKTWK